MQRLELTIAAMEFFSPANFKRNCETIGVSAPEGSITPLSGMEFLRFLSVTCKLPEADRYLLQLRQLLKTLVECGILTQIGSGGTNPMLPGSYYFLRELTARQSKSALWLMPALGPEFVVAAFGEAVVQLTGIDKRGDPRAGTGLVIAPNAVLTCAHVLSDMRVDAQQRVGESVVSVTSSQEHPSIDVGLLEITPPVAVLSGLSFCNPAVGETVFTLGYPRVPLSREPVLVLQRGEVTCPSIKTFDNRDLFLYSAIARPGNSGGPIISMNGYVAGMVTDELAHNDGAPSATPFHAGVNVTRIVEALAEIAPTIVLPVEDFL